jgi:hypothetical protein
MNTVVSLFNTKYINRENIQNRLTSNFDVYETLRELMGLPLKEHRIPVGQSLLGHIPTERDCFDVRVPIQFCMCMEPFNMPKLLDKVKVQLS